MAPGWIRLALEELHDARSSLLTSKHRLEAAVKVLTSDAVVVDLAVLKVFFVQFQKVSFGVVGDQVVGGDVSGDRVTFFDLEGKVVDSMKVEDGCEVDQWNGQLNDGSLEVAVEVGGGRQDGVIRPQGFVSRK